VAVTPEASRRNRRASTKHEKANHHMLADESIASIERFWASDLGCTIEDLRREQIVITRTDSPSLFIFARKGFVVAVPPLVSSGSVIGPAFIGYADGGTFVGCADAEARLLDDTDAEAVADLRSSCDALEWQHGGAADGSTCVGIFRGARLAALASYERWGDRIAHIGIVTHPGYRGQGLARAAVSALTKVALSRNLVGQYRTLVSNKSSMAIAQRLGFQCYAMSLAIRMSQSVSQ
jgi:GNAT superfamily N-acetyltransferase